MPLVCLLKVDCDESSRIVQDFGFTALLFSYKALSPQVQRLVFLDLRRQGFW